ncbi:MAG: dehydrogenase [Coriobacteriia bacterium]|nr:dehydrogenase [Coriobacteriia bacterium]
MARKARIAITREYIDDEGEFMVPGPGLALLDAMPGVEYRILPIFNARITPEQIQGYDFVLTMWPEWTPESLKGDESLLSVHRHGAGYETVHVPTLDRSGVLLCTNQAGVRRPVAVAAMTLLLALSTRLVTKIVMAREGRWGDKRHYPGWGLVGKTLGIIGAGSIGHEIFRLARAFDMKHIAYDPYMKPEALEDVGAALMGFEEVLALSDFLIICCPLNEHTFHLIGERELGMMKPTAFLINMARGPVVTEPDLIRALQDGVIRGAGIDVFEQEPTPVDNPLLNMENVIAEPHALGWTDESFMNVWRGILGQVSSIMTGQQPTGLVNRATWDSPLFRSKLERFQSETRA